MFNIYAAHQNVSVLGAITEEECSAHDGDYIKKRFGEFASFLLRYQHEKGGKMLHLKSSCQVQYLSNAFNVLRKKYPKLPVLRKGADENKVTHKCWYEYNFVVSFNISHIIKNSGIQISIMLCKFVDEQRQFPVESASKTGKKASGQRFSLAFVINLFQLVLLKPCSSGQSS